MSIFDWNTDIFSVPTISVSDINPIEGTLFTDNIIEDLTFDDRINDLKRIVAGACWSPGMCGSLIVNTCSFIETPVGTLRNFSGLNFIE